MKHREALLGKLGEKYIAPRQIGFAAVDHKNLFDESVQKMTPQKMRHHFLGATAASRQHMQSPPSATTLIFDKREDLFIGRPERLMVRREYAADKNHGQRPCSEHPRCFTVSLQ